MKARPIKGLKAAPVSQNKTQTAVNSGDKHCEFSHFCKLDVEEPLLAGNLLSGPLVSGEVGGGVQLGGGVHTS